MKKHAIVPIFIPHMGCPNDCIFCNQKIITAKDAYVSPSSCEKIIETHLSTLENRGLETIEIAFFGGSFTGIPIEEQRTYLSIAKKYKDQGKVNKIHLSTRPDYIDEEIIKHLKSYTVDTVELGVQSFHKDVLDNCKRGHKVSHIYKACKLLKDNDFELGIQLMIGLPGDTKEKAIDSARKAAEIKPELARLYPTVILQDTELAAMYNDKTYIPPNSEEMIDITASMYKVLADAGITIMRVGLKSTDLMTTETDLDHNYHPAFRQLIEGKLAMDKITALLMPYNKGNPREITLESNQKWFNNMIGHKGKNKKELKNLYPAWHISYNINDELEDGEIIIKDN